jgi:hypothetical protein
MKKIFLLGCLILITACQTTAVAPTPVPSLTPTAPFPPTPVPATHPEPTPTSRRPRTSPRLFTNQFDSSLAGWVILQAGNDAVPTIETRDSTLRLQIDSPYTWVYALYGAQDYTDAHVETEFINSALSPASIGLVCRYSDEKGWFEYNISTDGTYNLLYGRWLDTGIADYLPVQTAHQEIKQSGDTQQIGMTCSGTTVQLYINDTLIATWI